ncbi:mechanosensitive ion channel family protein [[Synechococcus] sp. NIES-970]|uniref:mechanosensitive ion channel family protein n=1 Tax=Picosynechococcus sp. NKBG15041c TaxID=1407650 RepID=UPI000407ADDA|nr:mechanosensitive ion channel family protein [Picosynechococcus sp. NKBG15041c]BAW97571.1 mechanosensitive ion channel family protein [[Synechococcus] sp. NIES-970]
MNLDFFAQNILGNTLAAYAMAIAVLVGGLLLINGFRLFLLGSLRQWAKRTQTNLDPKLTKIFSQSLVRLLYVGNISLAIGNLNLHPILNQTVQALVVIATTVIGIQLISQLLEYAIRSYLIRKGDIELEQSFGALLPILRSVLWAVGAVFLLDNLGFDISAVVASLGIGGLAIAFAAQGILGDLFSYFSIVLDRPFALGDFIIVGDFIGTVDYIGIKTTRLKSLSGEEIIIANTDLTSSRIRNFKRMERRRIVFSLGVLYETPKDKLEIIPPLIQDIISAQEGITFDRAHFASYGDFSLNYEIVYYVESGDYALYMDAQQKINLAIFEAFSQRNIEFAYPTNVTYVQGLQSVSDQAIADGRLTNG